MPVPLITENVFSDAPTKRNWFIAGRARLVPASTFDAQLQAARLGRDVDPLGPEPRVGRDPSASPLQRQAPRHSPDDDRSGVENLIFDGFWAL